MTAPDLMRLFPAAGHRLQMSLRLGDKEGFWGRSAAAEAVLAERRRWLAELPERHLRVLPEGAAAVAEAVRYLTGTDATPLEAAALLEPDWVVLAGEEGRGHVLLGGAVVFPSGWALEEKIGRPLAEVHAPVPGLQSSLGAQIDTFLGRLAPGAAWERDNWGLSADPGLNHHPALPVRRLGAQATLAATWLRLERQFLTRLPETGAVLFGIRVTNHRLDALAELPGVAPRLAHALDTMTAEVARYKGLEEARGAVAAELRRDERRGCAGGESR